MKIMLTKNFTLDELTRSATASQRGLDNTLDSTSSPQAAQVLSRLKTLCETVLQPIRDKYQKPIIVSSGYRSQKVNKAVGGAANSDHLYGCAADIRSLSPDSLSPDLHFETSQKPPEEGGEKKNSLSPQQRANKELFDLILRMIQNKEITVKQLIDEKNYSWIHISFQDGRTSKKNQVLHL